MRCWSGFRRAWPSSRVEYRIWFSVRIVDLHTGPVALINSTEVTASKNATTTHTM